MRGRPSGGVQRARRRISERQSSAQKSPTGRVLMISGRTVLQARWTMRLRTAAFVIVALSCASSLYAQTTGRLIGVVRDESRAVLPGATVTATSPALPGGPATTFATAQGEYQITD